MNSITQDANSCLQVTEVLPSWHCESDQTYPNMSEIHTHIDGRINMPYHDIAFMANNQQTTNTPFLQSKPWHCHSDPHDTIPTTPTPIFSTSRVSPCYWDAAVAEFVAIFHRCHAPPPPPWLTRLNTVSNQSCTTSSMTEVLPYFLQFSLLRVFSVKISTRGACDKQKTSPRISASFLLSPKRTPGGSVANPLHRCLERLPPASPQRKMLHQFTARFFFTDEFVCLLSDVIRWSNTIYHVYLGIKVVS